MKKLVIATTQMRHPTLDKGEKRFDSPKPLLDDALSYIKQALAFNADLICLPEVFANFNRSQPIELTAESMAGEIMDFLQYQAKKHAIGIIGTVYLKKTGNIINAGVAFNKKGVLVGMYPKVHAGPGEKIKSGRAFPVFEIEGVRAGIQICYDLNFPEGCRCLALQGADLVFWPNLWGDMPELYTDVIMRARAMENQMFLVSSAMFLEGEPFFKAPKVYGRSCIISWEGTVLAEVGRRTGIAIAQLDFDEPRFSQAKRRKMLFAHRKPEAYAVLVKKARPRIK